MYVPTIAPWLLGWRREDVAWTDVGRASHARETQSLRTTIYHNQERVGVCKILAKMKAYVAFKFTHYG
jgi:hypothetical protein